MPETVSQNVTERVRSIAEEVVADPLFVVDVVVRGQKGSRVVEIYVESDEDLTVDELVDASREIGFLLETEDVIDGKYSLNVSSPGTDRPLSLPRQFVKNVGRKVSISRSEPGRKSIRGTVIDANEDAFEIELENGETKRIAYGEAKEVRVLLPW